ncbi:hypothetical protein CMI47_03190 [Candidatus Pacearchaeota archaeon]|nr:hypothetical protein [Candidatus Pacearchaeota archaeon]
MADSSSYVGILSSIVGSIVTNEEFSTIYVNCNPAENDSSTASSGRSGLENPELDVLFPSKAATDKKVPLIGGSVVKIKLNNAEINTSRAKGDTNDKNLSKYRTKKLERFIKKLPGVSSGASESSEGEEESSEEESSAAEFVEISNIIDARLKINKCLDSMPSLSEQWYNAGVPSVILSRFKSPSIEDANDLDKELKDKASDKIRLSGLKPVGTFKFIPIEILKKILDILVNADDEEFGLKNYVGVSSVTFETLAGYLAAPNSDQRTFSGLDDDKLIEILLELFPIFHIDENYIDGEDVQTDIGYFTAHDKSLYIKMPDLSGRDSSGFSSNIYNLGEENVDEYTTFCFEMAGIREYAAIAFDYQATPVLTLADGDEEFPSDESKISITIEKEGLDENQEQKFFLSPIVSTSTSTNVRGFKESSDAVEMFTAPVLTKTYMEGGEPIVSVDDASDQFIEIYTKLLKYIQEDVNVFNSESLELYASYSKAMLKYNFFTIDLYNEFSFEDLGMPMSVPLTDLGIDNLSELLGEANRPEILLGARTSESSNKRNDNKFFNFQTSSARDIVASNRPNLILDVDEQIPSNWIELEKVAAEEDDEWALEIPYRSEKEAPALDAYNSGVTNEFALYTVDSYGQIVRAAGENVKIRPKSALATLIEPNGFGSHNLFNLSEIFGTMTFTGEGLRGSSVLITADELGLSPIGTLQDGDDITLSNTSDSLLRLSTNLSNAELFGTSLVGTYYFWPVPTNNIPSNPTPIYLSEDGATEAGDPPPKVITFDDPFGFSVPKFGKTVHSIPLLMDGSSNASITLKYKKKVFTDDSAKLYAYIAVASTASNSAILQEDVGWLESDGEEGAPIKRLTIATEKSTSGTTFLVPTALEYEFGSSDFEKKNKRKAILKFPGSIGTYINFSRFDEFEAESSTEYPAYILLTNKKLSDTVVKTFDSSNNDYAVIPIGSTAGDDNIYPAFVSAPHVLGFIAEIEGDGGSVSVQSNISRSAIDGNVELKKIIKKIDIDKIKSGREQSYKVFSCDKLTRLAVVFRGTDEPKLSKIYSAKLGRTSLKPYRVGRIKHADENLLVANYKKIKDIKDEGWVDLVMSKNDKRFKVTYDSTLYNRTTVAFDASEMDEEGSIVQESGDSNFLYSGEDKQISVVGDGLDGEAFVDSAGNETLASVIFPGGNGSFSPFPLITEQSYKTTSEASNADSYYLFGNPVKVYPSVDLVFGHEDSGIVYGMALSDAPVDENGRPGVEVIGINTSGTSSVAMGLAEIKQALENAANEAGALVDTLNSAKDSISEGVDDLTESISALDPNADADEIAALQSQIAEQEAQMAEIESGISEYEERQATADSALEDAEAAAAAQDAAEAEAIQVALEAQGSTSAADVLGDITEGMAAAADAIADVADAALGAVQDVMGAINDALALLQTISDALSSIANMANQVMEGLESAFGDRPSDFIKVNIRHIYIDKDSNISTSYISTKSDKTEAKLVVSTKFSQVSAIRFNVPEIVELRVNDSSEQEPYTANPPKQFSQAIINSGDTLYLKTVCSSPNTKIEIGGFRVKLIKGSPFEEGVYQNFIATVPDFSQFSLFGTNPCLSISMTNSNENRMKLVQVSGNDVALNLDDKWPKQMFGKKRNKQGPGADLQDALGDFYLRFTSVKLEKANIAKEFLQSFCDLSFHLTAELSLQLRNFKVLLIPIKVIFCIIDVICALLHPIRLVFAIIRLFLCLFDLILLLPQLSVPAMYLAILLHILELLLCVILKILGILNAINEIISALVVAIEQKNYASVIALEETLNEHLFSLEADLSVLEPIITILALFLELLMMLFKFPCTIGADDDDDACIDPSQLAGLIIGKVAPFGRIEPDALLPLAQAYTRLPVSETASTGNSPPDGRDNNLDMDCKEGQDFCDKLLTTEDFVVRPEDQSGATVSIGQDTGGTTFAGNSLTGLQDSVTGEFKLVEEGGWFSGDLDESGEMDYINYPGLRFISDPSESGSNYTSSGDYMGGSGSYFDATFAMSFTRSTKKFNPFVGPDPRIVGFEFNNRGETSDVSWWWKILLFPLFFRKKLVSELQTLDSPPMFLKESGGKLVVDGTSSFGDHDFVSPIDGETGGVFLEAVGTGYQPLPLTATIELQEPGVDEETKLAIFTPTTVTKTFGNIPMIALVDDAFNVYFVEEDGSDGGIKMNGNEIESINVKMINHPSAPKKKFSREEMTVYRTFDPKSDKAADLGTSSEVDGELLIKAQANAMFLIGEAETAGATYEPDDNSQGMGLSATWTWDASAEEIDTTSDIEAQWGPSPETQTFDYATYPDAFTGMPFPDVEMAYDFSAGNKKEANDIGNAIDSVKVFDFPRFYIVDMRQVADDIAAACGASGPMELLLDLPGFENPDEVEDSIGRLDDCLKLFLGHFKDKEEDEDGIPKGLIPRMRYSLENGILPEPASIPDAVTKFRDLQQCVEDEIGVMCKFVINPLNTSFKLLDDDDETPLTDYVNPEQSDLQSLLKFDIVEEIETEGELEGFPTITGAMEYASGIGDLAIVETGDKAYIKIIPRDCYDEPLHATLDLTEKIKIDFLEDETGSAELVEVTEGSGELVEKDDTEYTMAITAETEGKVVIKATVCSMVIQAVTDRGIISASSAVTDEVDCVDDVVEDADGDDVFAPGALMKVDRTLTILFVPKAASGAGGRYGDDDREESARSAKPGPQTFGTKLEN